MKKHNTFPNEQPEMPQRDKQPEINQPSDPKEPSTAIPENPQNVPEELPQTDSPKEDSPIKQGK